MLVIPYSSKPTEFEVQANLFNQLEKDGLYIRGEVVSTDYSTMPVKRVRFDIVVYNKSKKPIAVVEVKKKKGLRRIDQTEKYTRLLGDIPLLYCEGKEDIISVLVSIKEKLNFNRSTNVVGSFSSKEKFGLCIVNFAGQYFLDHGIKIEELVGTGYYDYITINRKRAVRAYFFLLQECGFTDQLKWGKDIPLLDLFIEILKSFCRYRLKVPGHSLFGSRYGLDGFGSHNKKNMYKFWAESGVLELKK